MLHYHSGFQTVGYGLFPGHATDILETMYSVLKKEIKWKIKISVNKQKYTGIRTGDR